MGRIAIGRRRGGDALTAALSADTTDTAATPDVAPDGPETAAHAPTDTFPLDGLDMDALIDAAVSAVAAPLTDDEDAPTIIAADRQREDPAALVAALVAADPLTRLLEAHRNTLQMAERMVGRPDADEALQRSHDLATEALSVARAAVDRPMPDPVVNVHVPERETTVNVEAPAAPVVTPNINVNVPQQPPPVVNVAAAEAPHVEVQVAAAAPPEVTVLPPSVVVPPSVVNVTVPAQQPRTIRVIEDPETGERVFTTEPEYADG